MDPVTLVIFCNGDVESFAVTPITLKLKFPGGH